MCKMVKRVKRKCSNYVAYLGYSVEMRIEKSQELKKEYSYVNVLFYKTETFFK